MLRDFLLLIIVAGGFLYGLKLMGMLDSFLAQQHTEKKREEEKQKSMLSYSAAGKNRS